MTDNTAPNPAIAPAPARTRRNVPDAVGFAALLVLGLAQLGWLLAMREAGRDFIAEAREAAVVDRGAPAVRAGTLRFVAAGTGVPYITTGWSGAGEDGAWSVGTRSMLYLPLNPALRDGFIAHWCGKVFVARRHPERMFEMVADGTVVHRWRETPSEDSRCVRFVVPAAVTRDGLVRLELASTRYPSPKLARQGWDSRRLGWLLHSLRLEPGA